MAGTSVSLQNLNFDETQLTVNYCGFATIVLRLTIQESKVNANVSTPVLT